MSVLDRWRERRDREWWDRFNREHRWDELGSYNTRVSRGIVHTSEYVARMRDEQAAFDVEHGHTDGQSVFPFRLEGSR